MKYLLLLSSFYLVACADMQKTEQVKRPFQANPAANTPPADYQGQRYVDNNGCVFLKSPMDGRWAPVVGNDRRHLCGETPTFK